jgi:hypothetical protein
MVEEEMRYMTPRNTNNSADDEFGFDHGMSEEEFNKRHRKALNKADSSYREKKPKSKKKRVGWVKIADGLYEKQTKIVKKQKKKKKLPELNPIFKGLGGGSSSKGPWK